MIDYLLRLAVIASFQNLHVCVFQRKKVINDKLKELRRAKRKKPAPVVKKAPKPKRLSVKAKEKLANHVAIRKATAAKKAAAKAKKPKAKKAATPAKKA